MKEYDFDVAACRERIGRRIKELRHRQGMSQYRLADLTGLQRHHITRIEQGRYSVGLDTLGKIGAALGMEVDFVVR